MKLSLSKVKQRLPFVLLFYLIVFTVLLGNFKSQTIISTEDVKQLTPCDENATCCPEGTTYYKTTGDKISAVAIVESLVLFRDLSSVIPQIQIIMGQIEAEWQTYTVFPSAKSCCTGLDYEEHNISVTELLRSDFANAGLLNWIETILNFARTVVFRIIGLEDNVQLNLVTCEDVPFNGNLCFEPIKELFNVNCTTATYIVLFGGIGVIGLILII